MFANRWFVDRIWACFGSREYLHYNWTIFCIVFWLLIRIIFGILMYLGVTGQAFCPDQTIDPWILRNPSGIQIAVQFSQLKSKRREKCRFKKYLLFVKIAINNPQKIKIEQIFILIQRLLSVIVNQISNDSLLKSFHLFMLSCDRDLIYWTILHELLFRKWINFTYSKFTNSWHNLNAFIINEWIFTLIYIKNQLQW